MGMKSLKWEGIGTKNLFPHTSTTDRAMTLKKNQTFLDNSSSVCFRRWNLGLTTVYTCTTPNDVRSAIQRILRRFSGRPHAAKTSRIPTEEIWQPYSHHSSSSSSIVSAVQRQRRRTALGFKTHRRASRSHVFTSASRELRH